MIKNIIFDIGNVLTDFRWKDFLREKGFTGEIHDRIAAASVLSPQWCEYDRGEWTDEEILDAFVQNDPEIEKEIHMAFDDFEGLVTPRDYAIPWVCGLKEKGYKVWYLSNFSRKAEVECAEALAFIPYMDGGILSYRDHVIKPDCAIYELLLERFNLVAEECVFLDDVTANVQGAENVGIHGILFRTKEQAQEELCKYGIIS